MSIRGVNVNGTVYALDTLPAVTSADAGKTLQVNSSGVWIASTPEAGLPSVTSSDAGKVLQVNSSGVWVAATLDDAEEATF